MEIFVRFCYFASMVVFCAGIGRFLVWDSAALSRWSRWASRAEWDRADAGARSSSPRAARAQAALLVPGVD